MWNMRRSLLRIGLWTVPMLLLALFYFYPLASIVLEGLGRSEAGWAAPFAAALASARLRGVLGFTTWQAALSTLLTLAAGLPAAYLFARFDFRGRDVLRALLGVPFVLPTLVVAAAFSALLGPRGWVNLGLMALLRLDAPPITFVNTLWAIVLAHVFYNTTIVARMVGDFWGNLDERLVGAARMLGASRWGAWRRVMLPNLLPVIAAAATLVFIFNFTSFGVILVLGGPRFTTLEVEIYTQTVSLFNLPLAAALSVIQLVMTLALTTLYTRLNRGRARPQRLRAGQETRRRFNGWREKALAGGMIAVLSVLFVAPLGGLALRSVTRLDPERRQRDAVDVGLTLDFYRTLSDNPRESLFYAAPAQAVITSLSYAGATVALALLAGLPAAWALADREESAFARWIDPVIMLPLGTSAVTLGLGFIVALDHPPLDLRASPILIPLAHTLVAFPFVVRSLTPALRAIHPRLRDAAAMLGATPLQALRYIDIPLVGRALIVAATFAFTISMGEFGATALVGRPEFPTIPVAIYRLIAQPGGLNYGQAMALSTILMAVTAGGMLAIERLRIGEGEF
jgi:thiamine transport system permease protein